MPTLSSSQGDQTGVCFVRIAYVVRPLIWHKDAALDLLGCRYPFLFTLVLLVKLLTTARKDGRVPRSVTQPMGAMQQGVQVGLSGFF